MRRLSYISIPASATEKFIRAFLNSNNKDFSVTIRGIEWSFLSCHYNRNKKADTCCVSLYFTSDKGTVRISDHWSVGSKVRNVGVLSRDVFAMLLCKKGSYDKPIYTDLYGFHGEMQGGIKMED